MPFKYTRSIKINNKEKKIRTIVFPISRFGKYKMSITFEEKVTELFAVKTVEEWLSKPLSEDYYNIVKDDLFHDNIEAYGENINRGRLLGDCIFLEQINDVGSETFQIFCGS